MSFLDLALAVTTGNIITLCFVWGATQLFKHDTEASYPAFAAFIFPLIAIAISIYLIEAQPLQSSVSLPQ